MLQAEAPNPHLYHFEGTLYMRGQKSISMSSEQMLLRGSQLRNSSWIIGVVVYTGEESKIRLNSLEAPLKFSNVDRLMNKQLYTIFAVLVICCLFSGIGNAIWSNVNNNGGIWYLG